MLKASKYEASHKIRFLRVVVDYNVDRMQVYRQRCHSRALLIARPLFAFRVWRYIRSAIYGHFTFFSSCLPYSGDYSTGVPPLPIHNREDSKRKELAEPVREQSLFGREGSAGRKKEIPSD